MRPASASPAPSVSARPHARPLPALPARRHARAVPRRGTPRRRARKPLAAVLHLQRRVGNRAVVGMLASTRPAPPPGRVQAAHSELPDFNLEFNGSITALLVQIAGNPQVSALFHEQFPERSVAEVMAVFGLAGLATEEARRQDPQDETRVRLTKNGNTLNVDIGHTYISPLNNILSFGGETPDLKLYKWFKRDGAPPGLGLRLFGAVREAAVRMGITSIEADAIGDPVEGAMENGYYTWARFGFDAPLEQLNLFLGRVGELRNQQANLPAEEEALATQIDELPNEARPHPRDQEANAARATELRNRRTMQGFLEPQETEELNALERHAEVTGTRRAVDRHGKALDWIFGTGDEAPGHTAQLVNLSDLFLLPEDNETLARLSALWQDYGQTVMHATFDLAPGSTSNRVLELLYTVPQEIARLLRERETLMKRYQDVMDRLLGTRKRKKRRPHAKAKREVEALLGRNKKAIRAARDRMAAIRQQAAQARNPQEQAEHA